MGKVLMGPSTLAYPLPAWLIGAKVADKPNFMTAAWAGICNSDPPKIAISIRHQRYTNSGIKHSRVFSVNIPSAALVKETDYCGSASGKTVDKVEICKFKIFYGTLTDAPLIEQCPVNMECKVEQVIDLGSHGLVIGEILETHVSEDCLTDGKPDIEKIKPFAYIGRPVEHYRAMGESLGKAFSIGQSLRKK
ncbi:MAG: flavin reductase family protein [Dehalococcoidales bacterium]|nr:flavin reductase family protein [Dehalococcoidales bacterium]